MTAPHRHLVRITRFLSAMEDEAGIPMTDDIRAGLLDEAIRGTGYRLVPLCDLPSEGHARGSDPSTSHDAGRSVVMNGKHEAVLRVLAFSGGQATDEEIASRYFATNVEASTVRGNWTDEAWRPTPLPQQSPASLRTRRAELVAAGKVRATGETRPTRSGRAAQVWECVDA